MKKSSELSTGEIAATFRVSQQSAQKLIDRGDLAGYRIPGSSERRASVQSCIELARQLGHATALADLESRAQAAGVRFRVAPCVLICTPDHALPTYFVHAGYQVTTADSWLQAGVFIAQQTFAAFVLDCFLGLAEVKKNAVLLATYSPGSTVCAVTGEDICPNGLNGHFKRVWQRPCDFDQAASELRGLMASNGHAAVHSRA